MTVSLVIVASGGSRALVRCADSAARQTASPLDILLAVPAAEGVPASILASMAQRLHVEAVHGATASGAVNAAVAHARGEVVAIVPAAFRLDRRMLERGGETLVEHAAAAVAAGVDVVTPEGRPVRSFRFDPRLPAAVADPRTVPPAILVTRAAWAALGPLDAAFGDLAAYEWWLRLLASEHRVYALDEQLVTFEAAGDVWWPPIPASAEYLEGYRRVLERHRPAIERAMHQVLIERETSFGRLLDRHRDLAARRDADLLQLDRLRAAAAHHRAYLAHYGLDGFDWGDWRRADPISRDWGYDRGEPIDRHYIDAFLAAHSSDVRGAVLEVQEDDLTRRFGGPKVDRAAVLDIAEGNPRASVVADLRAAPHLPDSTFDCIILTQTLHVIDDMPSVLRECCRLLRPGGVLLATLPCASRVCLEYGDAGDFWRVTPAGARALVEPAFGAGNVECTAYGNVLTNIAFLHGLGRGELTADEFAATDEYHPALVGVRARKPAAVRRAASAVHPRGVVLLYHRIHDDDDVHGLNVPPSLFERQLSAIARDCHPMALDDLLHGVRDGLPDGAVAVTFDDGYSDTLDVAAPLLERFAVPATVFATTRWIDEAGEYWWDTLERTLLGPSAPPELALELDGRRVSFDTASPDARREAHRRLHAWLVHARMEDRDRVAAGLAEWSATTPPTYRPLTGDGLRRLAAFPGIAIGAHSVNHLALPDQPSDVLAREVGESSAALAQLLHRRIDLFAYPYGAVDDRVAEVVRSSCRWGLTCDARPVDGSFDAARVPRVEVTRRLAPDTLRALVSSRRASG